MLKAKLEAKLTYSIDLLAENTGKIIQKELIMTTFKEYKEEQMKDPEFAHEYKKAQDEMQVIKAFLDARYSRNLSQKELAKLSGLSQSDISKLENGTCNPTIKLLQKIADGLDMDLKIEFVPKTQTADK